uniref:Abasic site processing protein HMCES n=1 Tax=Megaselia scalaris TaxID=36166 RepID=T1GQT7_MEGSC
MIPFWHEGDYKKHGLTTNNCRLEHMMNSKLFKGPFLRGQRCVVLCEGFYEWQTTKSSKPSERPAFYIYTPQKEGVQIHNKSSWQTDFEKEIIDEKTEPKLKLLKLAGLFDVWKDEKGDKIYSYSIITFESSKVMSWLHHRMPAILETDEEVSKWLDFKKYSNEEAMTVLKPVDKI